MECGWNQKKELPFGRNDQSSHHKFVAIVIFFIYEMLYADAMVSSMQSLLISRASFVHSFIAIVYDE